MADEDNAKKKEDREEKEKEKKQRKEAIKGAVTAGKELLTTPNALLALVAAVIFDILGLIPVIGSFSGIFAGLIIGSWMLLRKGGRKALKRYLLAQILGIISIVSSITPIISILSCGKLPASWIGLVYLTLKDP